MTAASCHSTNHHDRIPPVRLLLLLSLPLLLFFLPFSMFGRETRSVTIRQESSKTRKDKSKGRMCLIVTASSHDSLFYLNSFASSKRTEERKKKEEKLRTSKFVIRIKSPPARRPQQDIIHERRMAFDTYQAWGTAYWRPLPSRVRGASKWQRRRRGWTRSERNRHQSRQSCTTCWIISWAVKKFISEILIRKQSTVV